MVVWRGVVGLVLYMSSLAKAAEPAGDRPRIRVACVGDSITEHSRQPTAYPTRLQEALGSSYEVRNFGRSNSGVLKGGDHPYWKLDLFTNALAFRPHLVTILLGTNDTKEQNWIAHGAAFADDYRDLIRQFGRLRLPPRIFIGLPPPMFQAPWGLQPEVLQDQLIPMMRKIATDFDLPVVDVNAALKDKAHLFPDGVHPNAMGQAVIAETFHEAITSALSRVPLGPADRDPPEIELGLAEAPVRLELIPNSATQHPPQRTWAELSVNQETNLVVKFRVWDRRDMPSGQVRDDAIYQGDVVALYLQPSLDDDLYYEFEVNSRGVIFDNRLRYQGGAYRSDTAWDMPTSPRVRRSLFGGTWEVEFEVPLKSLVKDGALLSGRPIGLNLFRIDFDNQRRRNLYAWSPTEAENFHRLEMFGVLRLRF